MIDFFITLLLYRFKVELHANITRTVINVAYKQIIPQVYQHTHFFTHL